MKPNPLNLLLSLAQGGTKKTTGEIANAIGVSQQTASRWLSQLQSEGMVEKTPLGYRLTNAALKTLSKLSSAAENASKAIEIQGVVVKGIGDGAYYMSLNGYKKQIEDKLGFTPYPGTLNLKLSGKTDIENNEKLQATQGIKIEGFKHEGRFLGGAKCFHAKINGKAEGAVIIPDRTHHDSTTLEVISKDYLRKTLKLKTSGSARIESSTLF